MWLGHSVKIGCDAATPEQVLMGNQFQWVGRDEVIPGEDANMQPHRPMQKPYCGMSYSSVAFQLVGKMPKFSVFSGDSAQNGEV